MKDVKHNTIFTGKVCRVFDELSSTNDYASEWAKDSSIAEGAVVRANFQTAGRGQMGASWHAERGMNLTFSVVYRPHWLPLTKQWLLSESVALAVSDACHEILDMPVSLKWPNDIWYEGHKMGGILIQNSLQGNVLNASIIGIGLNVNQLNFPPEAPNATSLSIAAGSRFDVEAVFNNILFHLEQRYLSLKSGHWVAIHQEYLDRLMGKGQISAFQRADDQSVFHGRIVDVTHEGWLCLQESDGKVTPYEVKSIKWLHLVSHESAA